MLLIHYSKIVPCSLLKKSYNAHYSKMFNAL